MFVQAHKPIGKTNESDLMIEDVIKERLKGYGIKNYDIPASCSHFKRAAVLIGLQMRGNELHVVLTLRSKHLRSYPSTVAFPGGKAENESETFLEIALREAEEEIGLRRDEVEILCSFPGLLACPSLVTAAFVGFVSPTYVPKLNDDEVSELFWLPLSRFMSEVGHTTKTTACDPSSNYILHYFTDIVEGKQFMTWGFTAHLCILTAVAAFHENTHIRIVDTIPINHHDIIASISQLTDHFQRFQLHTSKI